MAAVARVARMAAWLACDGEISMAAVARIAAGLKVFVACPIHIVLLIKSYSYSPIRNIT